MPWVYVGPDHPHVARCLDAADAAYAAGAALRVQTMDAAVVQTLQLLADAPQRMRMGAAGVAFAAAHRGATQRVVALIRPQNQL